MAGTVRAISRAWLRVVATFAVFCLTATCAFAQDGDYQPQFADKPRGAAFKEYIFAIYPLHNPQRLYAAYGPLIDHLSAHMPGIRLRFEASRSYEDFERKLVVRDPHFILCNPSQIIFAMKHGYRVVGKVTGDADRHGIILLRADSPVQNISDLKGKKISFPAIGAFAGTMSPQYYLHTHGLNVSRDIEALYVGSQEASILSVYHKVSVAGATWVAPWKKFQAEHPDIARALIVKWKTDPLPNNGIAVRDDVPADVVEQVMGLLLRLGENEAGRAALDAIPASGFEIADAESYASTREFLQRFSAEIRSGPE